MILILGHVLNLFIVDLKYHFEVGLVLMLSPQPSNKPINKIIVIGKLFGVLAGVVNEYPRVDRGDTVEDRFGQIHLPFVFPRTDYILHLCISIDDSSWNALPTFSYLFLIHRQDVEGLIEFYPLACSDLLGVVSINHQYYYVLDISNQSKI